MTTLYRKWRPQTFAEVRGQERVVRTLQNALGTGRIGHAYLFCGPRGVGKTTTARLLAKAMNCLHDEGAGDTPTIGTAILPEPYKPGQSIPPEPDNTCWVCRDITAGASHDIVEIDAASTGRVDDVRDLRDKVASVGATRYKFYILDEAHQMTKDAFDALLKTLEEPPPRVVFVLATTDAAKLPPTVLSRCQRFDFRRISVADIRASLTDICAAEGIEAEPAALEILARAADGSSRDSQSLLDQAIAFCGATISLAGVRGMLGLASADTIERLAAALLAGDAAAGLELINQATDAGVDPRGLNRELVERLRSLLLLKVGAGASETLDVTPEALPALRDQAAGLSAPVLVRQIKIFSEAEYGFRSALQAQLPLELAFLQAIDAARPGEAQASPAKPVPEASPSSYAAPTPAGRPQTARNARDNFAAPRSPAGTPPRPHEAPHVPPGRQDIANADVDTSAAPHEPAQVPGGRPAVPNSGATSPAGPHVAPRVPDGELAVSHAGAKAPAAPDEAQRVPHGELAVSNAGAKAPAGPDDAGGPVPHDSHAVTSASGSSQAEGHASTDGPAVQTATGRPAQADGAQRQAPPEATPGAGTPGAEQTIPPNGAAVLETKAEWAPPAVPAGGDILQTIVQGWPAVLQAVRAESKNVEALLRSCSATAMDGATVTLACDGEFHARELQKPENKRLVEAGITRVAGQPCYVKCVVRDKKPEAAKPAPGGQPDAAKPDDDDPLVRAALRMLNARVLENN